MRTSTTKLKTPTATLGTRLRRLMGELGLGVGLVASSATSPVMAQSPAPQAVPQHWVSYAELMGNQFQDRLSDPASDAVVRLHGWMQERILNSNQPVPPPQLIVRVWVSPNGKVERVAFDSLGQAQADSDLRTLLTTDPISEPPPRDMRQPIVLQLQLSFVSKS